MNNNYGPLAQYNSLTDPNLQGFFSKPKLRQHLVKNGLINKKGSVVPENMYRYRVAQKEHKKVYRQMLATAIVQEAFDLERQRQAQIRDELEAIAKVELVRRIRGLSAQHRTPTLWPTKRLPSIRQPSLPIESRTLDNGETDLEFASESDRAFNKFSTHPTADNQVQPKKGSNKSTEEEPKKFVRRQSNRRAVSCMPSKRKAFIMRPTVKPCEITLFYHGSNVKLPCDQYAFDRVEEIIIYQQHCGGENLIVFKGKVEPNTKFTFESKRHKEYPFSLSIYINATIQYLIMLCSSCEYRHRLNCRIGGRKGKFSFYRVVGSKPCYKCLLERLPKPKSDSLNTTQDDVKDESLSDKNEPTMPAQLPSHKNDAISLSVTDEDKLKIPVKHEEDFTQKESNEYELDFDVEKSDSSQSEKKDAEKNEDKSKSSSDYSPFEPVKEASRRIPKNRKKPKSSSDETDSSRSEVEKFDGQDRQKTIQQDSDRSLSVSDNKRNYKWLLKFYTTDKPKKTANKADETVSFQIVGEKGETNPLKITSQDAQYFQSGQVDSFNIKTENIGKPKYIILSLISQSSASKWYLNKVELHDTCLNQTYLFEYNQCVLRNEFSILNLTEKKAAPTIDEITENIIDDVKDENAESNEREKNNKNSNNTDSTNTVTKKVNIKKKPRRSRKILNDNVASNSSDSPISTKSNPIESNVDRKVQHIIVPRIAVVSNTDITDTDECADCIGFNKHEVVHQSTARDEDDTANIRNGHGHIRLKDQSNSATQ